MVISRRQYLVGLAILMAVFFVSSVSALTNITQSNTVALNNYTSGEYLGHIVISSINISNSFVLFSSMYTLNSGATSVAGANNVLATVELQNETLLNISRTNPNHDGNGSLHSYWTVITDDRANVQRGNVVAGTTSTRFYINLSTPITTSQSFVTVSARSSATFSTSLHASHWAAQIINSTQIMIWRNSTGTSDVVHWQVVDFVGATVQSGVTQANESAISANLNEINTSNTFLYFNYALNYTFGISNSTVMGTMNSSEVKFNIGGPTDQTRLPAVSYFVISHPSFVVQNGSFAHNFNTQYTHNLSSPISLSRGFGLVSASTSHSADIPQRAFIMLNISNSTAIVLSRGLGGTSVTNNVSLFAINIQDDIQPVFNTWNCTGTGIMTFDNATCWDKMRVPVAGDHVIFNRTGTAPVNVTNNTMPQNLSSFLVDSNYNGVIHFNALFANGTWGSFGEIGTQNWTVLGNIDIRNSSISVQGSFASIGLALNLTAGGEGQIWQSLNGNITIQQTATLNGNALGFSTGYGPGAGADRDGGAHGGLGGSSSDLPYGNATGPTTLGSGGEAGNANGWGGSAIKLEAQNILINGTITMNGDSGSALEGGAGGSIWLRASNITLTNNSVLKADGASSTNREGGSGGRIRVEYLYNVINQDGVISVSRGVSSSGSSGESGTFTFTNNIWPSNLHLKSNISFLGGNYGDGNVINIRGNFSTNGNRITIYGDCFLSVASAVTCYNTTADGSGVWLNVSGSVDINGSSDFYGTGLGFPNAYGPGVSTGDGSSHGGRGGNGFDLRYGNASYPTSLGSGGSGTRGGSALRLESQSNITCGGNITMNAESSSSSATASGGSILIVAPNIIGSTCNLYAAGGRSTTAAESGGGGRIAVYGNISLTGSEISINAGNATGYIGQGGTLLINSTGYVTYRGNISNIGGIGGYINITAPLINLEGIYNSSNFSGGYSTAVNATITFSNSLSNFTNATFDPGAVFSTLSGSINSNFTQQGSLTFNGTERFVDILGINTSKSFLHFNYLWNDTTGQPKDNTIQGEIVNSTTLRFSRFSDEINGTAFVSWQVITDDRLSVQRGNISLTASAETNLKINLSSAINLSQSFATVSTSISTTSGSNFVNGMWSANFINSTQIQVFRNATTSMNFGISYQVVDWRGASVQSGTARANNSLPHYAINSVNLSNSFLYFTSTAVPSSMPTLNSTVLGRFVDSSTVSFEVIGTTTAGTDVSPTVSYFVVSHPSIVVQNGFVQSTADAFSFVNLTTPINTSRGFVFSYSKSASTGGSGNRFFDAYYRLNISNSTQIIFNPRPITQTNISWFAINIQDDFVVSSSGGTSYPNITFIAPTPSNGSSQEYTSLIANVSSNATGSHFTFVDFDRDVKLWLKMDDTNSSGHGVNDSSTYGNNLTSILGAMQNTTGAYGKSFTFNNSGYLNLSSRDLSSLGLHPYFTVSTWVFNGEPADASNRAILQITNESGSTAFSIEKTNSNRLVFLLVNSTGTQIFSISGVQTLFANVTWVHTVFTMNSTGAYVYLNGSMRLNATISNVTTPMPSIGGLTVGRNQALGRPWVGELDEMMIFNRSLSSSEILALYNATANQYYNNFTSLALGQHTLKAYAIDSNGSLNSTNTRYITITGSSNWNDNGQLTQSVTGCNTLNTTNAVYTLANSVSANTTCFVIRANNITLDGMGYTINYSVTENGYGVESLSYNESVVKNAYIVQANFSNSGSVAVNFTGTQNSTVLNNTLFTFSYGVLVRGTSLSSAARSNNIINNTIVVNASGAGISTPASSSVVYLTVITGNTIMTNDSAAGVSLTRAHYTFFNNNTIITTRSTDNNGKGLMVQSLWNSTFSNSSLTTTGETIQIGNSGGDPTGGNVFSGLKLNMTRGSTVSSVLVQSVPNDFSFYDSTFEGRSGLFRIVASASGGAWNLTNVTNSSGLPLSIIFTTGTNGTLNYHGYLDVNVTNSADLSSLENAIVNVTDVNGNRVIGDFTGSNGRTGYNSMLQFTMNDSTGTGPSTQHSNNFTVNVSLTGYTSYSASLNLSESVVLNVSLVASGDEDSTAPTVTLLAPINGTNTSVALTSFNATMTDNVNLSNATLYVWNSTGIVNQTTYVRIGTSNFTNTTFSFPRNGSYIWNYFVVDNSSNSAWATANFTINYTVILDSTPPLVQVTYPENTTYTTDVALLNYTFNSDASLCWYSLDSGATNSSIVSCGTNFTGLSSSQGTNIWIVYANDTSNNLNSSSVTFFKDSIAPGTIAFGTRTETNNTGLARSNIVINVTATDTNLANITVNLYNSTGIVNSTTSATSPNYINVTGLVDGQYWFNATAYDLVTNANNTGTYNVTLDASVPRITVVSPSNITYSTTTVAFNISSSEQLGACTVSLNGFAQNYTMTLNSTSNGAGYLNTTLSDETSYTARFACDDNLDNLNMTSTVTFFINTTSDTTAPEVTIVSPTATTYTEDAVSIEIRTNEEAICAYSLNNGVTNNSLTANSSSTGFTSTVGALSNTAYVLSAYCNDTSNNLNMTQNVTFVIDVPTSATSSDSSGGSSSGLSAIYTSQRQIFRGYSRTVFDGSWIKFVVVGEPHSVRINKIYSDYIAITVNSTTQYANLTVGEQRKFEINNDSYYDLIITLNSIEGSSANLTIKSINETTTVIESEENVTKSESGNYVARFFRSVVNNISDFVEGNQSNRAYSLVLLVVAVLIITLLVVRRINVRKHQHGNHSVHHIAHHIKHSHKS